MIVVVTVVVISVVKEWVRYELAALEAKRRAADQAAEDATEEEAAMDAAREEWAAALRQQFRAP